MQQINCYIPIKLRITGRLNDAQLDQLTETIVRAVAARISFAQRTIADHFSARLAGGRQEVTREPYDSEHAGLGGSEYSIASYQVAGKRAKVPLKKRQKPAAERVALAIFANFAAVYEAILSFYPDPKPRGNTMFGVYGVWEEDSKPYIFFVSAIVQEGASRGQPWLSAIPLVWGKVENGRFIPAEGGNVPAAVKANDRCELRVLVSAQSKKGKTFNATLRRQSGSTGPVFLRSEDHVRWRGKVIRFGVASAGIVIEVTAKGPPPPPEKLKIKPTLG